ncbi:aminopeptidase N [Geobacter hydrogenophilus]|uniref:Aminopeptidase N n=1 Tax=Geobacter hydrogenophilus TaxID=40983 RepID=A0A9W6LB04_9BACT|nr:aminopeptidase N [Geobacter hydrogenophilus]MBT0895410.1 aminopeptidase N [Geobacter hydrogenophilus]GLI36510.1 aminopeptidase N [Geobacter hydrogenophilus]
MPVSPHSTIYRADYTPPDYLVESIQLRFELGEDICTVHSRLEFRFNGDPSRERSPLRLDGHRFALKEIRLDGVPLARGDYAIEPERLVIDRVPASFSLEVETELRPQENTYLEGLYRSGGMFCTQCEAQGFRSITYYPDRPDVLSVFTTTIVADRELYPVLLSNGNPVAAEVLPDGRHAATWHDPFKKPAYLFALVAGNLVCIEDRFTTMNGREVALRIYVQEQNRHKCDHAMRSLKKAMRWDEERFGREYDLDIYMVVAVDDFNMGAMENKGLNIFNSRYVLASPQTATDDDFQAIEEVIGHEYFHNWSGNRITCRDWFQLSLKEGLTIYRDQEFSADMESRGVKRIAAVRYLRTVQFAEDAGPLAHPVRPDSYVEINNFYTATVYNKGAEVIHMLATLLGPERFRAGMDLYFARFDGQAVTIDDFVQALADAGQIDLSRFSRWYSQAGTPELAAEGTFDPGQRTFTLTIRQTTPPTPDQPEKLPFHIPVVMGLLGPSGQELPVTLAGESHPGPTSRVLEIKEAEERFTFSGIDAAPVPALLRGFSAPVKLSYPYRHDDLVFLMAHESDPFCRWEAGQRLAVALLLRLADDYRAGRHLTCDPGFVAAFRAILESDHPDKAFLAEALTLPDEDYLAELMPVIDPDALFAARQFLRRTLADELADRFVAVRNACRTGASFAVDDGRAGHRRLANLCLAYLLTRDDPAMVALALEQLAEADNMTDTLGALAPLASSNCPERQEALAAFYERWRDDRQVVDKWFRLQATSTLPGTLAEVERLLDHPAFELTNPNRWRSLIGAFAMANPVRFHAADGGGYRFLGRELRRLIPINPQVAARMTIPLTRWRRYDTARQALMKEELELIRALPDLPRDVFEIVEKSLME